MRSFDASAITELEPVRTVLTEIGRRAAAAGIEVMVVGAAARDVLIHHALGVPLRRTSLDIDIAVAVATWTDVANLTAGLPPARGGSHTFSVIGVEVDIIPFGAIESAERTILWPDDHEMNVFGFREALARAIEVRLTPELMVSVASLAAQSILKIMAWRDRRNATTKDAIDLRTILDAYSSGQYLDELYDDDPGLLEQHGFDPLLAGAARLGREAAATLSQVGQKMILEFLTDDDSLTALAAAMGGRPGIHRQVLTAYRSGFSPETEPSWRIR
jgi:predicted nucleotidyltransferase